MDLSVCSNEILLLLRVVHVNVSQSLLQSVVCLGLVCLEFCNTIPQSQKLILTLEQHLSNVLEILLPLLQDIAQLVDLRTCFKHLVAPLRFNLLYLLLVVLDLESDLIVELVDLVLPAVQIQLNGSELVSQLVVLVLQRDIGVGIASHLVNLSQLVNLVLELGILLFELLQHAVLSAPSHADTLS